MGNESVSRFGFVLLSIMSLVGCNDRRLDAPFTPDGVASVSSPIALSPDGKVVWVVNPDADSVTPVEAESLDVGAAVPVGREPWGVVVAPSGTVVVMNRLDGSLSVLEGESRTDIPVGPEPGGLALSPSGRLAYVTVSSADEVAVVDLSARQVVERVSVGRLPWAVAVTDDGDAEDDDELVVVSHRLARLRPDGQEGRDDGKEGWLTVLDGAGGAREIAISPYDFGYANVLGGLAVSGDMVFVSHLLNAPELPRDFETTLSGALSTISLTERRELSERRVHLNEATFSTPVNFPRAVALAPSGKTAYVVLAGSDAVMGIDMSRPERARLVGFWPTGSNPRGILLNREGTQAFVMNYLSRDVSVLDLSDALTRPEIARIGVAPETLDREVLRGKVLFNNANDPRLSHLGWISCASCHPGGGSDGTTWMTPDGPRQSMPLWNLEGTEPLHVSATRDEVQDFEFDVETLMDGIGLAPGPVSRELGEPNGGRSEDLDALALFVRTGIRTPLSASGDAAAVVRGRERFSEAGCAGCHGGPKWTVSRLPGPAGTLAPDGRLEVREALRDVGTYRPGIDVLGERGFDVPTLLGLHATAPYLHDGSATVLEDVLDDPDHAGTELTVGGRVDLARFLRSIDDWTQPFP